MPEARILDIITSNASLSSSLVNNLHCCKNMQVLNKQSAGLTGKTCSMVNLFLVVQRVQHTAANPTQNNLLWAPTRLEARRRRSEKEAGLQQTCSHDLIQHQKRLAKTQLKKIWAVSSRCPHRAQQSEPGPLRLRIWSPAGNRPTGSLP